MTLHLWRSYLYEMFCQVRMWSFSPIAPRRKSYLNVGFHKDFLHQWYCVILDPVQVIARGTHGPCGWGSGVLPELGKAEPHAFLLHNQAPPAGGDDLSLLRAGQGGQNISTRGSRGNKSLWEVFLNPLSKLMTEAEKVFHHSKWVLKPHLNYIPSSLKKWKGRLKSQVFAMKWHCWLEGELTTLF